MKCYGLENPPERKRFFFFFGLWIQKNQSKFKSIPDHHQTDDVVYVYIHISREIFFDVRI